MGEIFKGLGPEYLIPAVLVVLAGWVAKFLFDLGSSKRSSRKEFLELWGRTADKDDLQLEVSVRHLVGEYIPATIIREVLHHEYPSKQLLDLSNVWTILDYDPHTRRLSVRRYWFDQAVQPSKLFSVLYFVLAMAALFCLSTAMEGNGKFMQLIWAFNTVVLFVAAFTALNRAEAHKALHEKEQQTLKFIEMLEGNRQSGSDEQSKGAAVSEKTEP